MPAQEEDPNKFSSYREESEIMISEDGLQINCRIDDEEPDTALLGVSPIDNSLSCYFEIRIVRLPDGGMVAIGLADSDYPTEEEEIGWRRTSIGFHSDNGGIYHCEPDDCIYGYPTYGQGDVVGCGLVPATCQVYFTLNGTLLGSPCRDVEPKGFFFPAVSFDGPIVLQANFGTKPFLYDPSVNLPPSLTRQMDYFSHRLR
ncbi:hypothetical protein PAPYR_10185 [Paratrimastix pyriformis]|uniref:B30.2/SPRY domain-containing protein n=1 Tax=Paratrimastix pyriformis TaxID=342808 RepID=A0ABQ8U6H1_9EUKA|nr:hypothetical protein PAPYR_10185 [Paratrimastix pyriformis]